MSNNPPKQDDPDDFDNSSNLITCPYCNLNVTKICNNPISCSNRMTDFIMNQMMLN